MVTDFRGVEAVCNRKEGILEVRNIWYEEGIAGQKIQSAVMKTLSLLAGLGCRQITILPISDGLTPSMHMTAFKRSYDLDMIYTAYHDQ